MSLNEHRIMGLLLLAVVLAPIFMSGCTVVHFDDPPKNYGELLPIAETLGVKDE